MIRLVWKWLQALLTTGPDSELSDDGPLHRTPGVGIFLLDNLSFTTAAGWTHFFHRTLTIPEVAIFLEVKQVGAFSMAPSLEEPPLLSLPHPTQGLLSPLDERGVSSCCTLTQAARHLEISPAQGLHHFKTIF